MTEHMSAQNDRAYAVNFRLTPLAERLQVEEFAQPPGLGAADWNFFLRVVGHAKLVAGFKPRHHFADVLNIHNVRAMHAPEDGGIELFHQLFQGAAV